jgi:hypothetical protein
MGPEAGKPRPVAANIHLRLEGGFTPAPEALAMLTFASMQHCRFTAHCDPPNATSRLEIEHGDTLEPLIRLLQLAGVAQAAGEPLNIENLAGELQASARVVADAIERLQDFGLAFMGIDEGLPPILRNAGSQYLAQEGLVRPEVLRFLPTVIDDLFAREALMHAGTTLVDEFRYELLGGTGVDHARSLVPRAFAPTVDERLALDLFAATVALMIRLTDGRTAGCVAEEIMAVGLLEEARGRLEARSERGEITKSETATASNELDGIFELFEDDDVLDMFEMREPSDAVMAQHDPIKHELGVVDQRIENWFAPFGWTIGTGYLGE